MDYTDIDNEESAKDQRFTDRVMIPGATVIFRKRNKLGFFERVSRPMELYNFTKSGICFRSEKRFRLGDSICVDIIIPDEKSLRLVGQVRWIDDDIPSETCIIGAQFKAFGKGRNYNPMRTLEKLRILHSKFQ